MSFSASTCLTNVGTTPLGNNFNIYSNTDQFTNPFLTNVSDTDLFGGNCPYIMVNVPDGTTSIRIIDTLTNCCVTIDLLSNDLCTTCDLSFDSYQTNNIGRIVAGELTGSCESQITDYKIFWYGPDSTTNIAFTSGFGTEFQPYDLTHPLTGINSPTALSGEYIPIIDKVKLDGLNFSQTGGTGYIQAELECFNSTTVNVSPFNCSNGDEEGDYSHRVNFGGAAAGVTPLTLLSTFELDPTTNYFAWKFKGFNVWDSIKITFSGSSYNEPIILEYWTIGNQNISSSIGLLTLPKLGKTGNYLPKVTSLTSLTINQGDYLILEVTPNQSNPQTNWDFYFTCLETFDCSLCLDDYLNTPYKIDIATVIEEPRSCDRSFVQFDVSGCTSSELNSTDIGKYMIGGVDIASNSFGLTGGNSSGYIGHGIISHTGTTTCSDSSSYYTLICSQSNTNTIEFEKVVVLGVGKINMVFTDLNDLIAYKDSYELRKTQSGFVNTPTDIDYYKYVTLSIPNTSGNQICGDGTTSKFFPIHFSSTITTGQTGSSQYTLTMDMPTISNNLVFTTCEQNCESSTISIVNAINTSSTGTTNNFSVITNTGSRYTVPFNRTTRLYYNVNPPYLTGYASGTYRIYNTFNSTVPFSGSSSPYVQIPPLSSQTCDFTSKGVTVGPGSQTEYRQVYVYDYKYEVDPTNLTTWTIKANPISNGVRTSTNYPDTAVIIVNSVVTYSNPLYTF